MGIINSSNMQQSVANFPQSVLEDAGFQVSNSNRKDYPKASCYLNVGLVFDQIKDANGNSLFVSLPYGVGVDTQVVSNPNTQYGVYRTALLQTLKEVFSNLKPGESTLVPNLKVQLVKTGNNVTKASDIDTDALVAQLFGNALAGTNFGSKTQYVTGGFGQQSTQEQSSTTYSWLNIGIMVPNDKDQSSTPTFVTLPTNLNFDNMKQPKADDTTVGKLSLSLYKATKAVFDKLQPGEHLDMPCLVVQAKRAGNQTPNEETKSTMQDVLSSIRDQLLGITPKVNKAPEANNEPWDLNP